MTRYQALANAIIIQAAKDYKAQLRSLKRHPNSYAARMNAKELESFFRSRWFSILTDVNGEYLIKKLREEVAS